MSRTSLTHLNRRGDAHMVDVGDKPSTHRRAIADGVIRMQADTLSLITSGGHKKGDVLAVARIAGIMAAKKTSDLIPLCHQIPITHLDILFDTDESRGEIRCVSEVATQAVTGVEMEALIAVQIALTTIYDMCKAVDRGMQISGIGLVEKSGGRSGEWKRDEEER